MTGQGETCTLNVEGFPRELRRRVKVVAAQSGSTMRDVIVAALEAQHPPDDKGDTPD
jgi:hypothetical protein